MRFKQNLKIIKGKPYFDKRGYFKELLKENQINKKFPFIVMSYSKKNVLRGLHLQLNKPQGKFVTVMKGRIFDVAVDLRRGSKNFGKYYANFLSEKNSKSVYIPPGFAHGFLAREKENIVHYYNTNFRSSKHEIGIVWNDPSLKIKWPIKKPILSKKDKKNLTFKQFQKK